MIKGWILCWACKGSGKNSENKTCKPCDGKGWYLGYYADEKFADYPISKYPNPPRSSK